LRVDAGSDIVSQLEAGAHVGGDEVDVLAVAADVTAYERAERRDRQTLGASFGQRRADQVGSQAAALEAGSISVRVSVQST
jgi:hypothetical protein